MQVAKLGDSFAVVLPTSVAESHGLKEGDEVEIEIKSAKAVTTRQADAKAREEALQRLRDIRRSLPPGYLFDREEANAR